MLFKYCRQGRIFSAIPIAIIWLWLVQREEIDMVNKFGDEYRAYIEQTGQFLPSWRAMRDRDSYLLK